MPLIEWHVKSTTKAVQGLYEYDAVMRLRDSANSATNAPPTSPITSSAANSGRRSSTPERPVLLIDEVDKADIEFPNDLLQELDRMEFYVYELNRTVKAKVRPVVIITSNNEKELPDAFLRRCFFHYIQLSRRRDHARNHR